MYCFGGIGYLFTSKNLLGFQPLGNYWSVTSPFYVYVFLYKKIYKILKMIPRGTKELFVANILYARHCA